MGTREIQISEREASIRENLENIVTEQIKEPIESVETVNALFDIKDDSKGLSNIDLKTDLLENEIIDHTAVDFINKVLRLKRFDSGFVLGDVTNHLKRLKVSKNRKGREEAVRIFQSEQDKQSGRGFMDKWFKPRE